MAAYICRLSWIEPQKFDFQRLLRQSWRRRRDRLLEYEAANLVSVNSVQVQQVLNNGFWLNDVFSLSGRERAVNKEGKCHQFVSSQLDQWRFGWISLAEKQLLTRSSLSTLCLPHLFFLLIGFSCCGGKWNDMRLGVNFLSRFVLLQHLTNPYKVLECVFVDSFQSPIALINFLFLLAVAVRVWTDREDTEGRVISAGMIW